MLVEVIDRLTRVGEGHVVERQDRRRELVDIRETEGEHLIRDDRLDEAVRLHLVEDLLSGLGLSDQVGIRPRRRDELLDMRDLFLLLVICLHLVRFLFRSRLDVSVASIHVSTTGPSTSASQARDVRIVVTTVVDELLHPHIDHVRANAVQEIHAV